MADSLDITSQLKHLGLNDLEAQTYLILLSSGTTSIMRLAKELNLPRTTVYRLCQNLVDRHFLEWVITRQGKKIKAADPDRLTSLIKSAETKLEAIKSSLKSIKAYQKSLHVQVPTTQVRYYHGKEGMKQIIWNTLQAKHGIIGYSGFARNDITGQEFETQYAAERNPLKITDTVIINQINPGLKISLEKYPETLKYTNFYLLSDTILPITGDTYIYNDIYAVNFWSKTENIGVEIQNAELVSLQTGIFNQLISLCEPLMK